MTYSVRLAAIVVAASLGLASSAGAVTLSTGLGTIGTGEPNWTITAETPTTTLSFPFTPTIVTGAGPPYVGFWYDTASDALAANWITPFANSTGQAVSSPPADAIQNVSYTYSSLVFGNPLQDMTVHFAADNAATFFLNGIALGVSPTYSFLTPILIPQGAFGASNLFTVVVQNFASAPPNPTGLLVSAPDAPAVPLPAALPLFLSALAAMSWFAGRSKRRSRVLAAEAAA